jgi:hemerythrin-like domain-containing protein
MPIDSMNKVIHCAFRRDLGRLSDALGRVAEGDHERAGDLNRAWRNVHEQFDNHHSQEETLIFPAVVGMGVDPALISALEHEHEAILGALADVDAAMAGYAATASLADAAVAAEAVRRSRAVMDDHLAHEEADLEPALRPHLESAEWKAVERQIRKQPPTKSGWFFAWLEDGLPPEAEAFLAGAVPKPVRVLLSRVFGRGYHRQIAPVWR